MPTLADLQIALAVEYDRETDKEKVGEHRLRIALLRRVQEMCPDFPELTDKESEQLRILLKNLVEENVSVSIGALHVLDYLTSRRLARIERRLDKMARNANTIG